MAVTILPTDECCFGVTYREDKASVVESFNNLYVDGVYQEELYGDLEPLF